MIRICLACLSSILFVAGCGGPRGEDPAAARGAQGREKPRMLRHVVLLAFKEGTSPGQIRAIEEAFRTLPDKIDAIACFEWGTDVSPEHKSQGYTHCFLVTFRSEADRDRYLPHPAHQEFVKVLRPHLEKVLVVDYWASR